MYRKVMVVDLPSPSSQEYRRELFSTGSSLSGGSIPSSEYTNTWQTFHPKTFLPGAAARQVSHRSLSRRQTRSDGAVRGTARVPCIRPVSVHTFPRGQGLSSVIPEERWWKVTDSRWEDVHSPSWPWPSPPHWSPQKRPASAAGMPWTLCRSVWHQ